MTGVGLSLSHGEAEQVGERVRSWMADSGIDPSKPDALTWADVVQRVLFEARDAIKARPEGECCATALEGV